MPTSSYLNTLEDKDFMSKEDLMSKEGSHNIQ